MHRGTARASRRRLSAWAAVSTVAAALLGASAARADFSSGVVSLQIGQTSEAQTAQPSMVRGERFEVLLKLTVDPGSSTSATVYDSASLSIAVPSGLDFVSAGVSSQGLVSTSLFTVGDTDPTPSSNSSADGDGKDVTVTLGVVSNPFETPANTQNDFVVIGLRFVVRETAVGRLSLGFTFDAKRAGSGTTKTEGTGGVDVSVVEPSLVTVTQTVSPTDNVDVGDDVTFTVTAAYPGAATDPYLYDLRLEHVLDPSMLDPTGTAAVSLPVGYKFELRKDDPAKGYATASFRPSVKNTAYKPNDDTLTFVYTAKVRPTVPIPHTVTTSPSVVADMAMTPYAEGFTGTFTQGPSSVPSFTTGDTDRDSMTDSQESAAGFDPLDADMDDDGVPDGEEAGALLDHDGDGLLGARDPDSDGDGILDGVEAGIRAGVAGGSGFSGTNTLSANFQIDLDPTTTTSPILADTDGDGIPDGAEDANRNGKQDPGELDPTDAADAKQTVAQLQDTDGDGVPDRFEDANQNGFVDPAETDPNDSTDAGNAVDTDGDGVLDLVELRAGLDPATAETDTDGDGVIDILEDTDRDGVVDAGESDPKDPTDAQSAPDRDGDKILDGLELLIGTDPDVADPNTDGDALPDAFEDVNQNGVVDPAEGDPAVQDAATTLDADLDGIPDATELALGQDPNVKDEDLDDDGVSNVDEPGGLVDIDQDGLLGILDPDSDGDGLPDGVELGRTVATVTSTTDLARFRPDADPSATTDPTLRDTDGDGVPDGLEDMNLDGAVTPKETDPKDASDLGAYVDADSDGLPDRLEPFLVFATVGVTDAYTVTDTDGDHIPDVVEAELGTDPAVADPDTDRDGAPDIYEDTNRDGVVDVAETDPNLATDGGSVAAHRLDTDADGLPDVLERGVGLDPLDRDTDDDGLQDGAEPGALSDTDRDGLIAALDPDSDGDGLPDGLERGVTLPVADPDGSGPLLGTDTTQQHFTADGDPLTTTSALDPDTDGDGVLDGYEDANRNGVVDAGESDPNKGADGASVAANKTDTDGDTIPDRIEASFGLSATDLDSDDDGVRDDLEPGRFDDTDGDGTVGALDGDSDNDGIPDGVELGVTAAVADPDGTGPLLGTSTTSAAFVLDQDASTTWSAVNPDTDGDGDPDGWEDLSHDGALTLFPGGTESNPGRVLVRLADRTDRDGDGLPDVVETTYGLDTLDADTDDDGVPDGAEASPLADTDADGLIGALDADSDGDGLPDGLEGGVTVGVSSGTSTVDGTPFTGTDQSALAFRADEDPGTRTNPLAVDSDRDGKPDGAEDRNGNGRVEPGETDPALAEGGVPTDVTAQGGGIGCAFGAPRAGHAGILLWLALGMVVAFLGRCRLAGRRLERAQPERNKTLPASPGRGTGGTPIPLARGRPLPQNARRPLSKSHGGWPYSYSYSYSYSRWRVRLRDRLGDQSWCRFTELAHHALAASPASPPAAAAAVEPSPRRALPALRRLLSLRRLLPLLLFAALALSPRLALARAASIDADRVRPAADGLGLHAVESAEVLAPGRVSLGLHYAAVFRPLELGAVTGGTRVGGLVRRVDGLLFAGAIGLPWDLELSARLPLVVSASGRGLDGRSVRMSHPGGADTKVDLRWKAWVGWGRRLAVAGGLGLNLPTGSERRFRSDGGRFGARIYAAAEIRLDRVRLLGQLGYAWAGGPIDLADARLGDRVSLRGGLGFVLFGRPSKAAGAASRAPTGPGALDGGPTAPETSGPRVKGAWRLDLEVSLDGSVYLRRPRVQESRPLELLLGPRLDTPLGPSLVGGVGFGLGRGVTAPSVRAFAGLVVAFGAGRRQQWRFSRVDR